MSRRRQNTDLWKRVATALELVYKKSWRRRGEELFRLERGELRLADNAALPEDAVRTTEDVVAWAMHDRVAALREEADALEQAAIAFESESGARRAAVDAARYQDAQEYAKRLQDAWCEANVIDWKKMEAA
ncbi:hypothetical protein [Bradyrhizobium sp. SBR1B]|uniref:hypothetical protein n=1 Tax=Bradyrhizobium sp. SBR1B TaxID=2663836 RepID=UPI0016068F4B|nr:hypothetical protein [Bradyrhizobium sp. SBR1B]MBB4377245.1 hypothetical protein [Bradyrhizobium sp. SBR1B]